MNQETLNQFVAQMTKLLEGGTAFAVKEVPAVCQEVLRYYFWYDVLAVALSATFAIALCVLTKVWADKARDNDGEKVVAVVIAACIGIGPITGICVNGLDLIKLTIAPRLYLLEYFAGLVK